MKGVIFDMDGVLVDNMSTHEEAFGIFCQKYGVDNWLEILRRSAGMGNDEIMRAIIPAEIIEKVGIDALSFEKEALYREIYEKTIKPVDGLVDFLESLKSQGLKIAVGSSGCKLNVEFVLEKCGITKYFDALVYSELVTRCKPDPEIYLTAISKLGLEASECVIFEDARAGIIAAHAAGVERVVGVATTLTREVIEQECDVERVIESYKEITGSFC